ncbi:MULTISPECIES: polyprenyl synthetase family protein [unclassified Lentimicrobium]|uniref:polyprenyl synthetase family protein n=1 Tax=unclassified Lentimicrobium TaxID=2677434 RepID=UPI00155526BC|nr:MULTISPECIES: polyprenyl synthetase family protein [unclassified Lentimicrobium]NPD47816.1 polyprenyl synthetase family protein [Lentimicrobium sp. S6]NPD86072.1 polyprenyl synthetase family protein [Lentimicrobium sp. L6]
MLTIQDYQEIIKLKIAEQKFDHAPVELYEPITYTMSLGGKRLRPTLTIMTCDIFGGKIEESVNAALGLETFHNFTLLHDDIMDKAPIRRGEPTVYKKWDANRAILSGDTMMVLAYDYLLSSPKDLLFDLFTVFNKVGKEVCEGQQYDMNFETAEHVSIEEYLEMIKLKTAVLIGGSMHVGAIIARASADQCKLTYNFGENIGMAFQLQDDLLDAFGDTSVFGKQTGGDIRTNKKTYLYLKALELADEIDKKRLVELYTIQDEGNDEKVTEVLNLFNKYEISQLTRQLMEEFYSKAMLQLHAIHLPKDKEMVLVSVADNLMKRDS